MTHTEFSKKLTKNLDKALTAINGDQHPRYGHGIKVTRKGKMGDDHVMVYFNNGQPVIVNHGFKQVHLAKIGPAVHASLK